MTDEQFADLSARLAGLDMQVQAQGRLLMALALATPIKQRVDLMELLMAVGLNAAATEGEGVSRAMGRFAQEFLALTSPAMRRTQSSVKAVLALHPAFLASAPPQLAEAMQHWLSIASDQEIAEDALALLKPLLAPAAAPKKRGKRGSGGGAGEG